MTPTTDRSEAIDIAAGRLRAAGQRLTAPRVALVEALAGAAGPLTIPELQRTAPDLATSSAYRNLVVLEEVGVVHRIITNGDHARFELAEDLTEHHHHLICSNCGSVADVPASSRLEESVRRAADEIARSTGFRTQQHRVDLVGLCTDCLHTARRPDDPPADREDRTHVAPRRPESKRLG